jgi:hypothetical protein
MTRKQVRVSEYCRSFGGDWPPQDAEGFLAWVASKINAIPEEHRASTKIIVGDETEYDCSYPYIEFEYWRPETDEEMQERQERAKQDARRAEMKERRILEALKQKYG